MSKILKCDMCGKYAGKTLIDDKELKIQLPIKNKVLNFFIDVKVENDDVREAVSDFQHVMADMNVHTPTDADYLSDEDFLKVFKLQEKTIDTMDQNKDICICRKCKSEVIKLGLAYGSYNKLQNIQDAFVS